MLGFCGVGNSRGLTLPKTLPLTSKDSCFKAFGPKDPIIHGFWVILMLRAIFLNPKPCMNPTSQNNPWLPQLMVSLDSGFRVQGLGLGDGNRAMDPYDSPLRSSIASFVRVEGGGLL